MMEADRARRRDEESWMKDLASRDERIVELEKEISSLRSQKKLECPKLKVEDTTSKNVQMSKKNFEENKNDRLRPKEDNHWITSSDVKDGRITVVEQNIIPLESANSVSAESEELYENSKEIREKESVAAWKQEVDIKNRRIVELEQETVSLRNQLKDGGQKWLKESRTMCNNCKEDKERWKREIDGKNRRIAELERETASLENFLRDHADTESIRELEIIVDRKSRRVEELEDTIAEFEDFLKQNPDVKELHDLRRQVTLGSRRIQELERWIQKNGDVGRDIGIDQARIMELEEMVTQLEEYVREHNVDVMKRKLQDRECRIEQLQGKIGSLEKELLRVEEIAQGNAASKQKVVHDKAMNAKLSDVSSQDRDADNEKDRKMKDMEHSISEKDNRIQDCEQEIAEYKEELAKIRCDVASMEKELSEYEAEDIGVLKEEIRVRDERVQQLEDEIDSLERAFSERIDLEQIEELVNVVKKKEEIERQLEKDLEGKRNRIEELSEALRESVVIASDSERRMQQEERIKKNAIERIAKLEQRIASMQTASALKCQTCQPLLSKLQRSEKRLQRLCEERTLQLEDLHQMKREALKAAVSEKDAHLALLEHSGIKTATQAEHAEKLRADRKRLLERLKKEDERSIELSVDSNNLSPDTTPQLLTKILETSDNEYEDDEKTVDDRVSETGSPRPATTNGDSCSSHTLTTTKTSEAGGNNERHEIHRQDSR